MHVKPGRVFDMYVHKCMWVCEKGEREYEYHNFPSEGDLKNVRPIPWHILYLQYFIWFLFYTLRFSNQHHLTLKNVTADILRWILDLIQESLVTSNIFS